MISKKELLDLNRGLLKASRELSDLFDEVTRQNAILRLQIMEAREALRDILEDPSRAEEIATETLRIIGS